MAGDSWREGAIGTEFRQGYLSREAGRSVRVHLAGLIMAEIELDREDASFEHPAWAGPEVSGDPRYFNASLVANPFRTWRCRQ